LRGLFKTLGIHLSIKNFRPRNTLGELAATRGDAMKSLKVLNTEAIHVLRTYLKVAGLLGLALLGGPAGGKTILGKPCRYRTSTGETI